MMKRTLTILALLALSACGYNSAQPGGIDESVAAAISPEDASVIVVTVRDPLPVKSARLIDPAGQATEAFAIDTDRATYSDGGGLKPNVGVGVTGGSSGGVSTGIGIGFPLFGSGSGTATHRVTESRIRLRIADMAAYRLNWQRYKLAVDLDDGVNRRAFQMVPPPPL
ncbi:hypothetical protein [Dongia rigui]|uniref:Lipoprotein n=1 Tax=Dongia rigui TaxID=940149 RepID=A0ABU5DVX7_9PROT|nr:hypothetical protein [Dongia rigui]MDY0871452.1 hypothetical protein [Dongia rigui]